MEFRHGEALWPGAKGRRGEIAACHFPLRTIGGIARSFGCAERPESVQVSLTYSGRSDTDREPFRGPTGREGWSCTRQAADFQRPNRAREPRGPVDPGGETLLHRLAGGRRRSRSEHAFGGYHFPGPNADEAVGGG